MDKKQKWALKTGVDEYDNKLHYFCPNCGWDISLMHKKCPKCGAKRVKDAYQRAIAVRNDALRAARKTAVYVPDRTAEKLPAPKAPCFAAPGVEDAYNSCYATNAMAQLGVPKFYSSDEYGRVFEMPVCYKSLPVAGPVPVPAPSKTIQVDAIKVPIDIVH